MKALDELGISPTPWKAHFGFNGKLGHVSDAKGFTLFAFGLTEQTNARLIAAAPELYEALYQVHKYLGLNGDVIVKALAKASGEEVAQ